MATDSFTGANADPIGAPWVTSPTWDAIKRDNNHVTGSGAECQAYYTGAATGADQYSEIRILVIGTGGTGGEVGAAVRLDASIGNGYMLYSDAAAGLSFFRTSASKGYNLIGSTIVGAGGQATDLMRLEIIGTTLTGKKNGTSIGTQSDGTLATGQPGLNMYSSLGSYDDWAGGDLVAITWDQEGYRWRRDDGSEVTATYIAAEDTAP